MFRKTGFNVSEPFDVEGGPSAGGQSARAVGEFGRFIGVVMTAALSDGWEAWPNYPYGPITTHETSTGAIKKLRAEARKS